MELLKKMRLFIFIFLTIAMATISTNLADCTAVYAKEKEFVFQKNELMVNGKDSESIVFLILGDGFQATEQSLFDEKANELMNYILDTDPYSDMKQYMNFYSVNVISNESGAATNTNALKDTYFQCSYNFYYNIERLLAPTNSDKVYEIADYYVPDYDCILMLVNDERYGGSGGSIATASINESSFEIMLHEMGHSIGGLSDEYWAGTQYAHESENMTQISDPAKVPWSDLIGIDGIGVYPYEENSSWYHPSQNCKMEYLGKQYPFCKVCSGILKDELQELRWKTKDIYCYNDLLSMIRISPAKKTLYVGDATKKSITISANFPEFLYQVNQFTQTEIDIDHMEVLFTYQSSNPKVASVSKTGKITAKKKGSAEITVTAKMADGTSEEFYLEITVRQSKTKK